MPTNVSGRVTLILVILWLSLSVIFPTVPPSLFWFFKPTTQISFKPDLKPGIDMVGGTSLLYDVKAAPGTSSANLAEQVMEALKKRVDPEGVRNLIWRPQGNTRLEIQLPLTAKSVQAEEKRELFAKAQQQLEDTNIRPGQVLFDIQQLKGSERAARLKELEHGSETRGKILGAMATTADQIEAAKARQDAVEQARLEQQQDKLLGQLTDTNLTINQLQSILDLKTKATREQRLAELRTRFADFPERLRAMDAFIKAYDEYAEVRGTIGDASDLKRLLKGSGVLEFHILAFNRSAGGAGLAPELTQDEYKAMVERLKTKGPQPQPGDEVRWYEVERPTEFEFPTVEVNEKFYTLAFTTRDKAMTHGEGMPKWGLESARLDTYGGDLKVAFNFDAAGSRLFGQLTTDNVNRPLAIVLDDKIISAPNINQPIFGSGVISGGRGGFTKAEADYLIRTLNAGSLPAQLNDEPISEQTVGPQLGSDNLRAGLMASILGLIVVAVFMIVYYHLSGLVAVVALVMNMIMILGVMAALNATFTLPAVAGIVLTIGMSVDANVLVFERLREEQLRGLSLKMALRNAYDRAASAIIDSNVVTAITCVILYVLGSEEVKGFGLTLLIGLISSLFTALFVTKTIFAAWMNNFDLQRLGCLPLSFPAFGRLLHPNVQWMSKAKYFIAGSVIITIAGLVSLVATFRSGTLFDIEFSSGTSVQFELKQPMPIGDVRSLLAKVPPEQLPSPSIVSVGTDDKTYEVVTPSNDSPVVKRAILTALAGKLNLLEPSQFDDSNLSADQAIDKTVFPITADTNTVGGMVPVELRSYIGGAAIVLKNLNPKLTADEIKARLDQVRLQPQADTSKAAAYRQIDVETPAPGKSDTAVVLISDPAIQYDAADPFKVDQWTQELAKPSWAMVVQAINNPPELQKVSNFNPQVAGEMQRDALTALALSLLVVMGYIWLRFGNVKYGTATVVAMLHDTLLVIGFVGLSHYIGRTWFGSEVLLIEPFRVNLTLVAAVLTVMSYSMVDTIVVFDRVRENRGKFGHVDARIIDDSVNQTLSRTLLTGGTTVMTVLVMYLFGGAGIHGFTFVMLIGILVGTYSSIAIAAPILLIGEKQPQQAGGRAAQMGRGQLQKA